MNRNPVPVRDIYIVIGAPDMGRSTVRPHRLDRRSFLMLGGAVVAASTYAALGGGHIVTGDAQDPPYAPPSSGDEWERISPDAAGWNPERLEAALTFAGEQRSTAMVMLSGGRILAERYWQGWDEHRSGIVASVQKSLVAVLIGIAQHDGLLAITDPVSRYLGEGWSRAPAEAEGRITIRHLLTMTSGLDDRLGYEAEAGTVWHYNTSAYAQLKTVIERASGVSLSEYTHRAVWDRIGVRDSSWFTPRREDAPGQQWIASARDMARFGLLVLCGGFWGGETVIADAGYLAAMLATSQELNHAYGYLWWLNGKDRFVLPGRGREFMGSLIRTAPADMVSALGAGDKKIYVVPSLDLVVVRHGPAATADDDQARSSFDNELWQHIMAARR
jgi:CubicO group peptidase (beta-lactamase class C family)